jgi:small subunit ribosomal protein S1
MDNPWDTFEHDYSVGKITDGKVVRIIEKGIIAELPSHVDGFVPTTQLSTSKIKNIANHFPIDSTIPLKVIEFDKESKKIVLSAIAALKEKSDAEIEQYINTYKLERVTVQNIQSAEMGTIDSSEFPIFEVPEPETTKKEETE